MNGYEHNEYPDYRSRQTMQDWYEFLLSQAVLVDFAVLKSIGDPQNGVIIDKLFPER